VIRGQAMILYTSPKQIIFECERCQRTLETEQGVMDAKNIFEENGWQCLEIDGKFYHYCADHRRS
jgi:hypothetical protein